MSINLGPNVVTPSLRALQANTHATAIVVVDETGFDAFLKICRSERQGPDASVILTAFLGSAKQEKQAIYESSQGSIRHG